MCNYLNECLQIRKEFQVGFKSRELVIAVQYLRSYTSNQLTATMTKACDHTYIAFPSRSLSLTDYATQKEIKHK